MQNKQKEVKHKVTTTYRKRLRQILKSHLNAKNKMQAINIYAMPVITYTAGIIGWNKKEMQNLDRITRKTMKMCGGLHPRADIHRLYLPKKEGCRGLREVATTVRFQCAGLQGYISKAKEKDPLIEAVWKHQAIKGYERKKEEMENGKLRIQQNGSTNSYMDSTNGKYLRSHQWIMLTD